MKDEVRAYESGSSGYNDGHDNYFLPSLSFVDELFLFNNGDHLISCL